MAGRLHRSALGSHEGAELDPAAISLRYDVPLHRVNELIEEARQLAAGEPGRIRSQLAELLSPERRPPVTPGKIPRTLGRSLPPGGRGGEIERWAGDLELESLAGLIAARPAGDYVMARHRRRDPLGTEVLLGNEIVPTPPAHHRALLDAMAAYLGHDEEGDRARWAGEPCDGFAAALAG